jgi:hypothetical protein
LKAVLDRVRGRAELLKTMIAYGVLALELSLAAPNLGAAELDALAGRYTFNWKTAPIPKKCLKIDDKLLSEFRSKTYTCDLTQKKYSASGEPFIQCTKTSGTGQYMIFKRAEACEKERRTQEANGDG